MSQGFVSGGFNAKIAGDVIQVQRYETGAVATGTTTIPADDTIPQNTEGDQYMSVSITPTNVNSTLKIDVVCGFTNSGNGINIAALFQDSTANAISAMQQGSGQVSEGTPITFTHYMTAGTTSSTTFKVRAGNSNAGTTTFNGSGGARRFGGVMASSITVTEIASGTLVRESGYNINGNAGVAKAWCMFNGNTAGTNAPTVGHNVTSVTRTGTGAYTINLTTPFSSANFVFVANASDGTEALIAAPLTMSASAPTMETTNGGGTSQDADVVCVVMFGTQ